VQRPATHVMIGKWDGRVIRQVPSLSKKLTAAGRILESGYLTH
jgi:hypothetical protein